MDKITRIDKLVALVNTVGGEITGRKKIHKIVYLCQQKGIELGQDFIFHHYGVYSPSLSDDLQQAEKWELIEEKIMEGPMGMTYKYTLNGESEDFKNDVLKEKEFISLLAEKQSGVLEVLSTIVYLDNQGYSGDKLLEKLDVLKGHLDGYFPEAIELAKEMFNIHIN
ncbi:MAG: hypothetical protein KGZ94_05120 [Clostridia bacterium]|nr:hypothetical protein [Clostridia bacterium]